MGIQFRGRREDERLTSGRGRYTSDHNLPKQTYAAFLRSDRAHAEIATVDTSAARGLKGVIAVITGADIARENYSTFDVIAFFQGKGGTKLKIPHRPVLAHERVRFVGETVAMVVAESPAVAIDACDLIEVDYKELPAVIAAEGASAKGAPQLHADVPGNHAFTFEYGDEQKTNEAFARAAHVVDVSVAAQRIAGNPMEPRACVVSYNTRTDTYEMHVPNQGRNMIVAGMAKVMNLPGEKFRVNPGDVGGGFGIRGEVYPEYVAAAYASRMIGRPVKWTSTRAETLISDHHGRGADLSGSLALDEKGNFLAQRIQWRVNVGAYCSEAGPLINTAAGPANSPTNIYRTPQVHGLHDLYFTNTTPTCPYRGAGRPNVVQLAERLVDEAARVTGIDRIALRRRNFLKRSDFPYRTPVGTVYDSGDPAALLDRALKEADWKGFAARRKTARKAGKLRGIGIASFVEPAGGPGHEEAALKFGADGKIILYTASGPSGQGHETAYPEIVSRALGIPADQITLHFGDPDGPALAGPGTIGSRSTLSSGAALDEGAKQVIEKAREFAANELEVAAADLEFSAGRFSVPGTDLSIGLQDIVEKLGSNGGTHPLDTTYKLETATTYPTSVQIAEIEIDPDTGELDIIRFVAVDDCGNVMNHKLVEGQIVGGVIQGLGQALGEQCVYDEDSGQFLTGTFMDYYMPRADIVSDLAVFDLPVPSPNNSLGVKGAGEAGTTGSPACMASAVFDALAPLGIHDLDMPFTPFRIWSAIRAAGGVPK